MKFHHVYIEIINQCQFHCSFCPKTNRESRMLSPLEFQHIINEVKPYTSTIYLHVVGEPLLHPQLDELLAIAYHENMTVCITTNGYLIQSKGPILLKYPNIQKINFSLHSLEDIAQADLSQEAYIQAILDFANQATKNNSTIIYRLWNTNLHEQYMLDKLKEAYHQPDLKNEVSPQNGIRLAYRTFLHQANLFKWPVQSTAQRKEEGYCLGLKTHIGILSNGTVIPCCLDNNGQIALGNIFETPLEEILQNEFTKKIKEGFQSHKAIHPLCQTCSYKERFEK